MPDEFIIDAQRRYAVSREAMEQNHERASEDVEFVTGKQWSDEAERLRKAQRRPMMTFNKVRQFIKHVANEQRQNRPGVKVNPANADSTAIVAEMYEGLIRNIENVSNAEYTYDYTLDQVLESGYGYWRILTKFIDEEGFEQDAMIGRIKDRFSVTLDHSAQEWTGEDGQYAFIERILRKDEFKKQYPDQVPSHWGDRGSNTWLFEDQVRIAEYFYKKPVRKHLVQFDDGNIRMVPKGSNAQEYIREFQDFNQVRAVRERKFDSHVVKWAKISPFDTLEEQDWPGMFIPVIPCYGDVTNTDEGDYISGLTRFMKDGSRIVNYFWTAAAETVALSPKEPVLATAVQVQGREKDWNNWHKTAKSLLLYNHDPDAPGKPGRLDASNNAAQVLQLALMASNELHELSGGINPATLGKPSNEQSGIAIETRASQGQLATFNYLDNLSRSIAYSGRVLVDIIPKVYDTERIVRILGSDGAPQLVGVNGAQAEGQEDSFDLKLGRYDVVVESGPSHATRRQEVANTMTQIITAVPGAAPMLLPLLLKNVDAEGAEEALEAMTDVNQQDPGVPTAPDRLSAVQ